MIFETKMTRACTAVEAALAALNSAYDHTPDLRSHEELDALRGQMLEIVHAVRVMRASKSTAPGMLVLNERAELFHDEGDYSYKAVVTRTRHFTSTDAYSADVDVFLLNGTNWSLEDTVHLPTGPGHVIERARFWPEIIDAVSSFYSEDNDDPMGLDDAFQHGGRDEDNTDWL